MNTCLAQGSTYSGFVVGAEDWRYTFSAAKARTLATKLLTKSILLDMANAQSFEQAIECLSGSEYAFNTSSPTMQEVESLLLEKRKDARKEFSDLMLDEPLKNLVKARNDFSNMRLAIRRVVTDRAIGSDYSDEGAVKDSIFAEVFEQENYSEFPEYLQEAVEAAVLAYYENKDIRQIDNAISRVASEYYLAQATELKCEYLCSLVRIRADLGNIKTMLRLKFLESEERGPFLTTGSINTDMFVHGLDLGYDGLAQLFYPTDYSHIVEAGTAYLVKEGSFLRFESLCDKYLWNCYKEALAQITAGPQPVMAYACMKTMEIRTLRMILTAKKNHLVPKLILDRLGLSPE